MKEKIYTNYRLQLPSEDLLGTLVVRDGYIADIQPGVVSHGQDGDGEYLLPGLIELHTDNFERNMAPRPGVRWPLNAAAVNHDRDLISAGVTTVCDAIAVGDTEPGSIRMTHFGPAIDAIHAGQEACRFLSNHRIHLRCELGYNQVADVVERYIDHPLLSLLSLMDHTPGQRQFVNLGKFKEYYMGKHGVTGDQMDSFIEQRFRDQQLHAVNNRSTLVKMAQTHQIPMASHDDATIEHVREAIAEGASISEFPTTLDAAREAHQHGLQVLMGSPNLILGGSHSGNVSALELIQNGLVDILSSDYVPRSLVQAIFLIADKVSQPVHEAMKLFTINPAKAIGLEGDRGSLETGKRADLITVKYDGDVPLLTAVTNGGKRVA